jgi:hypothetical protein
MWLTLNEVIELGASARRVQMKLASGEWESRETGRRGRNGKPIREIALSSLPTKLQQLYAQRGAAVETKMTVEIEQPSVDDGTKKLQAALVKFSLEEREALIAEARRLAEIVSRYEAINPRQQLNPATGEREFVPAVATLCEEARCTSPVILAREPSRGDARSPYTLDGWMRRMKTEGLLTFVRSAPSPKKKRDERDGRKALISPDAVEWVNSNWRNSPSPRQLYKKLKKKARQHNWRIPSESWIYRLYRDLPEPVRVAQFEGQKAYTSKHAPFVPRTVEDVEALQVVCGDHSQRDVTVLLRDGTIARPWLTLWQDIRTSLLWGWHLDLIPSSFTAGMAYADGVRNYGAQPLSRPDEQFYSHIYTDQGRDYKSKNWDGETIAVHQAAMRIEGGLEVLRVQRKVGFLEELDLKHILARGYNAREKPVERVHRDISDWEQNTFKTEFCGRDAKNKPDRWREAWAQHQRFAKGKRSESPFIALDDYREALAGFIHEYNTSEHERVTLNGAKVVPVEEYQRLYVEKYGRFEIAEEALALLLMKAKRCRVGKNGVEPFRRGQAYLHESMSLWKGKDVEVRFTDNDYSRVWVVLPDAKICEAQLVSRSPFLNPNKQTMKMVAEAAAHERKVIREFNFITQSRIRGESVEDRVAALIGPEQVEAVAELGQFAVGGSSAPARVQKMTRMDGRKLRAVSRPVVTTTEMASVEADETIFETPDRGRVSEFDFDE